MTDETRQPLEQASRALWPQLPFFFPHSNPRLPWLLLFLTHLFFPFQIVLILSIAPYRALVTSLAVLFLHLASVTPRRCRLRLVTKMQRARRQNFCQPRQTYLKKNAPSSQSRSAGRSTPRAAQRPVPPSNPLASHPINRSLRRTTIPSRRSSSSSNPRSTALKRWISRGMATALKP